MTFSWFKLNRHLFDYSLNRLYSIMDISKQAIHQNEKRSLVFESNLSELIIQVDELRKEHPGCGIEKMYKTLNPDFIGRDRFIEIFMELGYRIKRNKNYIRTTTPTHIRYPNYIEGLEITRPNQVWQSDITYIHVGGRFYYIIFIIDVYTRKIISWEVNDNMRKECNIRALKKAIKTQSKNSGPEGLTGLIHHSDRGSQYIANDYIKILKKNNIEVSMGLIAQENAFVERINGTIKNEYLKRWDILNFRDLKLKLNKAVKHYNKKRKHSSLLNEQSPELFQQSLLSLPKEERPRMIIFAEGKHETNNPFRIPKFINRTISYNHNCPLYV